MNCGRKARKKAAVLGFEPQRSGKLKVIGGYHELASGRVDFFDQG